MCPTSSTWTTGSRPVLDSFALVGGYGHLIASIAVFFATHSIPAIRPLRTTCVSAIGERVYLFVYSLISIAAIAWMVSAAIAAPYLELWPMTVGTMWGTAVVMLPATVFLVFGLTTPNPLSIPVRKEAFDPEQPGILAISRHPVLVSFVLWATAHLLSNGSLSALILFGFAALFSVGGMFILDARRRRTWGQDTWQAQSDNTALLSAQVNAIPIMDARWLITVAAYGLMIWLHPMVIGVQPLPM